MHWLQCVLLAAVVTMLSPSSLCKEQSHATQLVCNQFADHCLAGLHTSAFFVLFPLVRLSDCCSDTQMFE